jgi:Ca2+-binding RTX toxin-like protein
MFSLVLGGTYSGGALITPATTAELLFTGSGSSREVRLVDFGAALTSRFGVTGGSFGGFLGQTLHTTARTGIIASSFYGSVVNDILTAALAPGQTSSVTGYLHTGNEFDDRVELLGTSVGGVSYLLAAESSGTGFSLFSVGAGNALSEITHVADTAAAYAGGTAAMASVTLAGHSYILTGSATESGVSCYEIMSGGQIQHRDAIGVAEVMPLQGVTTLRAVSTLGQDYVIVGSTTNSGLSVLAVATDGTLTATDHVVDDLTTRFAGVTALGSIEVNGRSFIVAGGTDNGISLFTLMPGGQLLHLQTLADSAATTLAAPSAIGITQVGTELQVFVASGTEAGLTMYRIDIASLGLTAAGMGALGGGAGDDLLALTGADGTLSGGAGADILRDGPGNDALRGGGGADIFVLTADGRADTILDYEPGKDRIDLTLLPWLRNVQQPRFTPVTGGVVIQYGIELLTVLTIDGRSLTAADFPATSLLPMTRSPIVDGATGQAQPPAAETLNPPLLRQGTASADALSGTAGADFLNGMAGNDTFTASAGADHFDGGTGTDTVSYAALAAAGVDLADPAQNWGSAGGHSFASVERFIGSAFGDAFRLDAADNELLGDDGNDTLDGGGGNDLIDAGTGNDVVNAGDGDDSVNLADGDDTASGAAGGDSILGGNGNDLISGSAGPDSLDGGGGHDLIAGGSDDDTLLGGIGDDTLNGGGGDDEANGGADNDVLFGGTGHDLLSGGDGEDTISGGAGDDILTGGLGADAFLFEGYRPDETDVITDFEGGVDMLWLKHVAGVDDAARFDALNVTDTGSGVEVSYGGHIIFLDGIGADEVDIRDILFL